MAEIKEKRMHDRRLIYEDDDEVRPGVSYLRDLDSEEAEELFRKAKEEKVAEFKISSSSSRRGWQLRYWKPSSSGSVYWLVRKGYNDGSGLF